MKTLCVCSAGLVRSHTLSHLLKAQGHDSLAVGIDQNSEETLYLLYLWADKIILLHNDWENRIPKEFKEKVIVYHVGLDRFGIGFNPELISILKEFLETHPL